jgi:hypothetical protein
VEFPARLAGIANVGTSRWRPTRESGGLGSSGVTWRKGGIVPAIVRREEVQREGYGARRGNEAKLPRGSSHSHATAGGRPAVSYGASGA